MIILWIIAGLLIGALVGWAGVQLQPVKYRSQSLPAFLLIGLVLGGTLGVILGGIVFAAPLGPRIIEVTATPDVEKLAKSKPAKVSVNFRVQPFVLHPNDDGQLEVVIHNDESAVIDHVEVCLPMTFFGSFELTDAAPDSPYDRGREDNCLAFGVTVQPNSQQTVHVPFKVGTQTGLVTGMNQKADVYLDYPEYPYNISGSIRPEPRTVHREFLLPLTVSSS